MSDLETAYRDEVDREIDRLSRLLPCELMQLTPRSWKVETSSGSVDLACLIHDLGDVRHIAVMAQRPVWLGLAYEKFYAGIKVKLTFERMSDTEAADLYD